MYAKLQTANVEEQRLGSKRETARKVSAQSDHVKLFIPYTQIHLYHKTNNEQRNIQHEIRKRKANWIGHIVRRNCLLKQVIEGEIKGEMLVTRRRKKLLDDLKDKRGYCHMKEEALDRTIWRNRIRGGFGPAFRQNIE